MRPWLLCALARQLMRSEVGVGGALEALAWQALASAEELSAKAVAVRSEQALRSGPDATPGTPGTATASAGQETAPPAELRLLDLDADAAAALAASLLVYTAEAEKDVPLAIGKAQAGFAGGGAAQEAAWLAQTRKDAQELLAKGGWVMRARLAVGGRDEDVAAARKAAEARDPDSGLPPPDVPAVVADVYIRGAQALVAFRGTDGEADYADNFRNLLPQMVGPQWLAHYRAAYAAAVAEPEAEKSAANSFYEFALQVGEAATGFVAKFQRKLAAQARVELASVEKNGYLGLLPKVFDEIQVATAGLHVQPRDLLVTGHSAGAVRAEALAGLVADKWGRCPRVVSFAAPGSCAPHPAERRCAATEVGAAADWYSTAVVGPPAHRQRYVYAWTEAERAKVEEFCGPVSGEALGTLVLTDKQRFAACRWFTHTAFSLWQYLVTEQQALAEDPLPASECRPDAFTSSTVGWLVGLSLLLALVLAAAVFGCVKAGCCRRAKDWYQGQAGKAQD